jgi:hypothetical protein
MAPEIQLLVLTGVYAVVLAISLTLAYLVTWRVARRFGMRGLTTCLGVVAIVGPPRDYAFARQFPAWITFAPGLAPILAVAVTYVLWIAIGHGVMRLFAGPARSIDA